MGRNPAAGAGVLHEQEESKLMKLLDLFAGIGGFSLAAHWMGWETSAFVEWDPFCQKVLQKNFPNIPIYGDIREFDGTQYWGAVDIVCGGFPCQPFSTDGKRKGENDDRYLWPEMLRVISKVRPSWIVGENVAGITSMDGGKILQRIELDLGSLGYEVEMFNIPACSVGLNHSRERLWITAHHQESTNNIKGAVYLDGPSICAQSKYGFGIWSEHYRNLEFTEWDINGNETNKPALFRENDGFSRSLDESRTESLGNAVSPLVAYELFQAIEIAELERA